MRADRSTRSHGVASGAYRRRAARVARSSLPNGYYHVVARGIPEQTIFLDDQDRTAFVRLFERVHAKHGWACHAYCLMATHYHLVLTATREALSAGLCELNGLYARGFNQRHGRFGHLFANRFSSRLIESEEYLYDACSYVVLNPVKARLCDRVEQWPWSFSRFGLESS